MPSDALDRLKAAARDRWGDRWTIRVQHFATGNTKAIAFHSRGTVDRDDVDGKVLDVERLQLDDDGRLGYDRVHVSPQQIIDVRERDRIDDADDSEADE